MVKHQRIIGSDDTPDPPPVPPIIPSWVNWQRLKPILWQAFYAGVAAAIGYIYRELGGNNTPLNVIADGIRVTTGVGS